MADNFDCCDHTKFRKLRSLQDSALMKRLLLCIAINIKEIQTPQHIHKVNHGRIFLISILARLVILITYNHLTLSNFFKKKEGKKCSTNTNATLIMEQPIQMQH